MRNILIHISKPISASGYYRALLPYRHCRKQLQAEGIELHIADQIRIGSQYDAIIVHREVPKEFSLHLNQRRKRDGCKFVWDVDDDFWSVPDWSPVKYTREQIEEIDLAHTLADEIWASTDTLAKKCRGKAYTLPNLVDCNDWHTPQNMSGRRKIYSSNGSDFNHLRILWSGSTTHRRDLLECKDAILSVALKHVDASVFSGRPRPMFHFYGYCPEPIESHLFPHQMVYHEWTRLSDYIPTLQAIKPDIVLAPLLNCEFNDSKSNIRFLEGVMAGGAVIASKCEPYKMATMQVHAMDGWTETINKLIESRDEREAIRLADYQNIRTEWCWQSDARNKWLNAFRRIAQ